jgi:Cd(II)/Pb(II)-responsive transcriptional regulator
MKIGELAQASSTPVETIRYYERQGLLAAPARTAGNFRDYDARQLERLRFIRYCRGLDMSLDEVRVLLRFRDQPQSQCGDVNTLLDEHIGHVTRRIAELRSLQRELKELRSRCASAQPSGHCGILSGIAEAAHDPPASRPTHLQSVHRA